MISVHIKEGTNRTGGDKLLVLIEKSRTEASKRDSPQFLDCFLPPQVQAKVPKNTIIDFNAFRSSVQTLMCDGANKITLILLRSTIRRHKNRDDYWKVLILWTFGFGKQSRKTLGMKSITVNR